MRLIPGRTKVKIEIFKGITLADVGIGLVAALLIAMCVSSSLPGKWIVASLILSVVATLLVRLDDDPLYVFVWHIRTL